MPTCPKCGSPRVNRFCAKCGASANAAPPLPRPPQRKRSGVRTLFILAIAVTAAAFYGSLVQRIAVPISPPATISTESFVPQLADDEYHRLDVDLLSLSSRNRALIADLESRDVALDNARAALTAKSKSTVALQYRLDHAMKQATEDDRWPTRVEGQWFDRPALQDAITRVNAYVRTLDSLDARLTADRSFITRRILAARDAETELQNAQRTLARDQRLLASGVTVPSDELTALRAKLDRLQNSTTPANLPDPSRYALPTFDLKSQKR